MRYFPQEVLDAAMAMLPPTFYADRDLPFRLLMLLTTWRNGIEAGKLADALLPLARAALAWREDVPRGDAGDLSRFMALVRALQGAVDALPEDLKARLRDGA